MEAGSSVAGNRVRKRWRLNERAWGELFQHFDGAGLTVEAFCQREGLSRSSFNRWRSRLPMRSSTAAATAVGASDDRQFAATQRESSPHR